MLELEGIISLSVFILVACLPFIVHVIKRKMDAKLLKEFAESRPVPVVTLDKNGHIIKELSDNF